MPRTGRELVVISPGGFEGFFRGLARADAAGALTDDVFARISAEYGVSWLE